MRLAFTFILLFTFTGLAFASTPPVREHISWVETLQAYRSSGNAVATDDMGNIYVTGNYEEWMQVDSQQVKALGNIFRNGDIFLAKYNSLGIMQWWKCAGGVKDDAALALAISGENIYITGYFSDTAWFDGKWLYTPDIQNMFLANYSPDGEVKWVKQAKSDGVLRGTAMTADKYGNVIITGNFREKVSFDSLTIHRKMMNNIYIVKYDSLGQVQWLRQGSGGSNLFTFAFVYDIATDGDGNIYLAGEAAGAMKFGPVSYTTSFTQYQDGTLSRREIFLVKYDHSGNICWLKSAASECRISDMAVDISGNIYLTGYFTGAVNGGLEGRALIGNHLLSSTRNKGKYTEDIFLSAYDTDGALRWVKKAGSMWDDRGTALTTTADGSIFWAGYFNNMLEIDDVTISREKLYKPQAYISKLSATGDIEWVYHLTSTGGITPRSLATSPTGQIYVTGNFAGSIFTRENVKSGSGYDNLFLLNIADDLIFSSEEVPN